MEPCISNEELRYKELCDLSGPRNLTPEENEEWNHLHKILPAKRKEQQEQHRIQEEKRKQETQERSGKYRRGFGYLLAIPSGLYVGWIILQGLKSFLEAPIGIKKHADTGDGWIVGLAAVAYVIGTALIEINKDY